MHIRNNLENSLTHNHHHEYDRPHKNNVKLLHLRLSKTKNGINCSYINLYILPVQIFHCNDTVFKNKIKKYLIITAYKSS